MNFSASDERDVRHACFWCQASSATFNFLLESSELRFPFGPYWLQSSSIEALVMDAEAKKGSPQDSNQKEWDRIAASAEFQHLLTLKKRFILPAFLFFFVYYFALPISIGYAPKFMSMRVIGTVNLAYLFALSQFAVGWIIAWSYLRAAAKFDRLTKDLLRKSAGEQGGR
jgi:uncharacterized membrane protein (DUF485 family)